MLPSSTTTCTGLPFMPANGCRLETSSDAAYREASIRIWDGEPVAGSTLSARKRYDPGVG